MQKMPRNMPKHPPKPLSPSTVGWLMISSFHHGKFLLVAKKSSDAGEGDSESLLFFTMASSFWWRRKVATQNLLRLRLAESENSPAPTAHGNFLDQVETTTYS